MYEWMLLHPFDTGGREPKRAQALGEWVLGVEEPCQGALRRLLSVG